MQNIEHNEQCAVIKWWHWQCKILGFPEQLLFAIPNGGARSRITGAILKEEGVRPGIPDLFLAIPNSHYHGLFVEMKKPRGGKVSGAQSDAIAMLMDAGYMAIVQWRGKGDSCN